MAVAAFAFVVMVVVVVVVVVVGSPRVPIGIVDVVIVVVVIVVVEAVIGVVFLERGFLFAAARPGVGLSAWCARRGDIDLGRRLCRPRRDGADRPCGRDRDAFGRAGWPPLSGPV
ncbi:MAG: hypothetical protein QGG17_06935 [Rhodospirillales bacterium]|jgi:hypothetical protein|nr:hypothetical protein [Rhodospirillales bacterium]MDP6806041.1 hypothetical protein [Rhodospirillales bacterium]